jgi:hypothetical protein
MHLSTVSINGTRFHLPPHKFRVILFTFATQLNTNLSLTSATQFIVSYKQTFTNIPKKWNPSLMKSQKVLHASNFLHIYTYKA